MSKKVTIPTDGGNPFVVILGGIKYVYKPGETVEVPDGVALEIEEWERWKDKYHGAVQPPFAAGGDVPAPVQSDLSQNDPNAADYVKGKEEFAQQIGGSNKVIVEKTFVTEVGTPSITQESVRGGTVYWLPLYMTEEYGSEIYRLIEGETYTFKAPNGTEHIATAEKRWNGGAISLFFQTDSNEVYVYEDLGMVGRGVIYRGSGLTTGLTKSEYSISGKFEKEIRLYSKCWSVRLDVDYQNGINRTYIEDMESDFALIYLRKLIGHGLHDIDWKIIHSYGYSNTSNVAYPAAVYATVGDYAEDILEATLTYNVYDESGSSSVKKLNLRTGQFIVKDE